ncbi:hypothetical protein R1sor_013601 [Riccia sorocarpa]|uniref:Reverse transcriptase n=1 Tax=Riccia sorocarpa TaxID=122646 RepID=A0ABD3H9N3_9MARC
MYKGLVVVTFLPKSLARINSESSVEELDALTRAEERLLTQELQDARKWKTRSRDKWLAEDAAPAMYFFAKLRSKWARESINALEDSEGEILTERAAILAEIHRFYQDMYAAEPETPKKARARDEVAGTLDRRLSSTDSSRMSVSPTKDEIEVVVFCMARHKAPGYDGLTIDVVWKCWEFVCEDCVQLVQIVWAKKRVLHVVVLLPVLDV